MLGLNLKNHSVKIETYFTFKQSYKHTQDIQKQKTRLHPFISNKTFRE